MSLAGVVLMYGMTVFSTNEPKPKSGMCVIEDCKNIFNDNKKKRQFCLLLLSSFHLGLCFAYQS